MGDYRYFTWLELFTASSVVAVERLSSRSYYYPVSGVGKQAKAQKEGNAPGECHGRK